MGLTSGHDTEDGDLSREQLQFLVNLVYVDIVT